MFLVVLLHEDGQDTAWRLAAAAVFLIAAWTDRIDGQKTAAFEIADALGDAPDVHCLPVGNAGNITAYWKGYGEYAADGTTTHRPRMLGFQAAGAAPIVTGQRVPSPSTGTSPAH